MAYVRGGLIEAVDFNTFRSQLLQVYGVGFGNSGYGQTAIVVPTVAGGLVETVKSLEWTRFRNAIGVCADHQSISTALLPPTTALEPGDVIFAHDGITDSDDFSQMLTDIAANRLVAPAPSTSVFLNRSTQSITNAWVALASTVVNIDFVSADAARYFFNSGGEIIVRTSFVPLTPTVQNVSWQNLLTNVGTVVYNHNTTVGTGSVGTGSAFGYYNTSSTLALSTLFTASPVGEAYFSGVNVYSILARTELPDGTNGDNGARIRLEIRLADGSTGYGVDSVQGTLTVAIDERRATTYLTVPSFTVSLVTPLSAA